jgi:hypothetical protein
MQGSDADSTLWKHPHCHFLWKENKALLNRVRATAISHADEDHNEIADKEHPARETVKFWLSVLALHPSSVEDKPLSKDLALVRQAVAAIVEAEEAEILTESEAEAVNQFILSKFVERRFDKTLREFLTGSERQWFLAASRYLNE